MQLNSYYTCKYRTSCGVSPNIHTESPVGLPATATQDDIGTTKLQETETIMSSSTNTYFFPSGQCYSIEEEVPKTTEKSQMEFLSLFSTCIRFVLMPKLLSFLQCNIIDTVRSQFFFFTFAQLAKIQENKRIQIMEFALFTPKSKINIFGFFFRRVKKFFIFFKKH